MILTGLTARIQQIQMPVVTYSEALAARDTSQVLFVDRHGYFFLGITDHICLQKCLGQICACLPSERNL